MNIDSILFKPHLLVAGATGSGKSVFIRLLLKRMTDYPPEKVNYCIVDLKRIEFTSFQEFPHCRGIAKSSFDAVRMIDSILSEIGHRYKKIEKGCSIDGLPDLFLVIDEYADLLLTNGKSTRDAVAKISIMGRSAKVHLILATQRPTKDICGLTTVNITDRIGLRTACKQDSKNIINQAGCEMLPRYGSCLYLSDGYITRIDNIPFTTDSDILAQRQKYAGVKNPYVELHKPLTFWDWFWIILALIIITKIFSLF